MTTPVSSPPRPLLPSSDSSHSSTSLPHSHLQSKPFIFKLLLFISSLFILCISLIFAFVHWHHLQSLIIWTPHACTLASPTLEPNPSNSSQYRVTATAQVSGISASGHPMTAYYGPTTHYTLSAQQAHDALESVNINRLQTNSTCYLSSQSPPHVSLQILSNTPSNSTYIAWAATFIAAVMGLIQLNIFIKLFHKCMNSHFSVLSPHLNPPAQVKSSFLTSQQTSYVCHTYLQHLNIPQYNDWACAICLDDHSPQTSQKGVKLPCLHTYHQRCIQEWLTKGKSVCPLCNWDVKSIFKNPSIETTRHSEEHASPECTTTDSQPTDVP